MKFYKISATQNTFFFIEEKELQEKAPRLSIDISNRPDLARLVCTKYGTSADGFVIVKSSSGTQWDYEWDFYNNDGSSAEMCGNASRAMALFVRNYLGFKKSELTFKTIAGLILVQYLDNNFFRVKIPEHKIEILWQELALPDRQIHYCFINTGVPHVVVQVPDLQASALRPLVDVFRSKKEFGPAGTNVSFFSENKGSFEGVTFERGVEAFTASCGTGVVAMSVAIFNHQQFRFSGDTKCVKIRTPGGELSVEQNRNENFCWLIGLAQLTEVVECLPK